MIVRYPHLLQQPGVRILKPQNVPYAKYKQERTVHNKTVFLAEHSVVFVLNGYKQVHFEEHTLKLEPASLLLLKRGIYVMSEYIPEGLNYEALIVFFNDKFLKEFLLKRHSGYPQPKLNKNLSHVTIASNKLFDNFKNHYLGYFDENNEQMDTILQVKLHELFLLLTSGPHKQKVMEFLYSITHAVPIDIGYIVKTHLFQPLSTEELAKLSGRSLASFKRDFHHQYHSPPRKWINEQRLSHARVLLHNTEKTISEIAFECGFESVPHFIRIFKTEFGNTPQALRTKTAIV